MVTIRPELCFGERFRVRSRRGNLYALTFLQWIEGASGAYVRMDNRRIARIYDRRVVWSSWATASDPTHPALTVDDEVMLETRGGGMRGRVKELGSKLRISLQHGAEVLVPLSDIERLFLLYRAPDLQPGDRFLALDQQGGERRAQLLTEEPSGLCRVELEDGTQAFIALTQLDMETLRVLIPIPLHDMEMADALGRVRGEASTPPPTAPGELFLCCDDVEPVRLEPDHPVTIGRSSQADLRIQDSKEVSRLHAEVVSSAEGVFVRDLGSANGTFVRGIPVGPEYAFLAPGQAIRIGGSLRLTIQEL